MVTMKEGSAVLITERWFGTGKASKYGNVNCESQRKSRILLTWNTDMNYLTWIIGLITFQLWDLCKILVSAVNIICTTKCDFSHLFMTLCSFYCYIKRGNNHFSEGYRGCLTQMWQVNRRSKKKDLFHSSFSWVLCAVWVYAGILSHTHISPRQPFYSCSRFFVLAA